MLNKEPVAKKTKVALVTGGSRGIGKAIALKLAEDFDVAITYKSNLLAAQRVVSEIKTLGRRSTAIKLDYCNVSTFDKKLKRLMFEFKSLDLLINNAGLLEQKPFEKIMIRDFDNTFDTDLRGVFFLSQKALPYLLKTKGCIINISSIGGQTGGIKAPHYAAAKAGIISLTKSLSNLYAPLGVRVNAVAPGHILTDMTRKIFTSTHYRKNLKRLIPLARVGTPEEVASVVGFLASKDASYITGQTININGGMYLG